MKRGVDVFAALFGLIVTAPVIGVLAILIKLTSRGPVLYRQERVGLSQGRGHRRPAFTAARTSVIVAARDEIANLDNER